MGDMRFRRYGQEATVGIRAVREAARLCRQIEEGRGSPTSSAKPDLSPVTVADFASQAVVARRLEEAFPEDSVVAEEDAIALRTPGEAGRLREVTGYVARLFPDATPDQVALWIDRGRGTSRRRFWALDPLDGTKGFLRGGQYVVALALIEDGQVMVGVLGCPRLTPSLEPDGQARGAVVVAVREEGAWASAIDGETFTRLHVSDRRVPAGGRVLRSFEDVHTDRPKLEQAAERLGTASPMRRMDSQAKYAVLAAGGGEWVLRLIPLLRPDYVERIWDHAAGSLVVEEAGGCATDLRGERLDFGAGREMTRNLGVLASNGRLHAAALEAIRAVGADRRPEGIGV
jgi:3'(2'), 5'-bisphosphate nucleotidase